jgi:hypothetical protein
MASFESTTHSFVIRIWLEEPEETGRARWRGHITHVLSGERRYLENMAEVVDFIRPYLAEMGVTPGLQARLQQWLRRRRGAESP